MKIAIFGAAGQVGSRVVAEALARGHTVTAVHRRVNRTSALPESVEVRVADASRMDEVVRVTRGHEVVVDATRSRSASAAETVAVVQALMAGLARTGARLIVVGGAATLWVPGRGRMVLDDPDYLPAEIRPVALASAAQLDACRAETEVDWTYLSPPAALQPGIRTGAFRLGRDELLVDDAGRSRISIEDLAVALLDEAERPSHRRTRFTAAY